MSYICSNRMLLNGKEEGEIKWEFLMDYWAECSRKAKRLVSVSVY